MATEWQRSTRGVIVTSQLGFTDRALEPEQQAIVEPTGIVEPVRIDDAGAGWGLPARALRGSRPGGPCRPRNPASAHGWLHIADPGWLHLGDPDWLSVGDPGWLCFPDPVAQYRTTGDSAGLGHAEDPPGAGTASPPLGGPAGPGAAPPGAVSSGALRPQAGRTGAGACFAVPWPPWAVPVRVEEESR
jgi:hypothetical protein